MNNVFSYLFEIVRYGRGRDLNIRVWFDTDMPDGTPRKLLDSSRLASLGFTAKTSLQEGLQLTYSWYLANCKALGGAQ
jgi:nucleoside-diphosphate-sugar epimerase